MVLSRSVEYKQTGNALSLRRGIAIPMDGRDGGPPPGAVASTADTGGFHPGAKVWVAKDGDDGKSALCNNIYPCCGKLVQARLELLHTELLSNLELIASMLISL